MIEVGEYIRTDNGEIAKVIYNATNEFCYKETLALDRVVSVNNSEFIYRDDIVKHKKDIIDLIEVGDYVNGYLIVDKWYDYANKCYHLVTEGNKHIFEEDIKTILTHEMYEQNCYKVGVD